MKTIRSNVFETNSSSTHSLTLIEGPSWSTMIPNSGDKLIICGGEYGWGYEMLDDPYSKASYAYQDGVSKKLIKKVIKDYTGISKVKLKGKKDGYVDHQSIGTVSKKIYSEEDLRIFIFNDSSYVTTDNDNH